MYAIGDAGQVTDEPCACGRNYQSIINLQGRCHDILTTRSGKQLPGQFWTTLSRSVPGIGEFQVVQKDPENIELRVKVGPEYRSENEQALHDKLRAMRNRRNEAARHLKRTQQQRHEMEPFLPAISQAIEIQLVDMIEKLNGEIGQLEEVFTAGNVREYVQLAFAFLHKCAIEDDEIPF